ncbi:MAG: hypothetical protein ACE5OZ_22115 [Candidatus Heimdallarchaeota archaeon]
MSPESFDCAFVKKINLFVSKNYSFFSIRILGKINVYFDSVIILTAVDNRFSTSEKFMWASVSGATRIDNITVSDDPSLPDPTTITELVPLGILMVVITIITAIFINLMIKQRKQAKKTIPPERN